MFPSSHRATIASRCALPWICRTGMLLALLVFLLLPQSGMAAGVVVFNEVMYHPQVNEALLEWVELHNQNAVDVELSDWELSGGISYRFPIGTVIRGGSYLVIAASPATLEASGISGPVLGPFVGRLSNSGEKLNLHDRHGRLMDAMKYGVDGEWPSGPDGGGVSLAKRSPNLASDNGANWIESDALGGSPGTVNTATVKLGNRTMLVPLTQSWRFHAAETVSTSDWQSSAFDDSSWPAGLAPFAVDGSPLDLGINTPLPQDPGTFLFRTRFVFKGSPASYQLGLRHWIDDGAVFYLNGAELARFNMPTGTLASGTLATNQIGNAKLSTRQSLSSPTLIEGTNVVAVEVHQARTISNPGLKLTKSTGFGVAWDGDDGDFSSASNPALAPENDALTSRGTEIIVSSNSGDAPRLNDGRYGSSSSWSPSPTDTTPSVVLKFPGVTPVSSLAWSRDNGNSEEPDCGGTCRDRALGSFVVQYTLSTNPASITGISANPTNGWVTVATLQYVSTQPGFTPWLRHRFQLTNNLGAPILATGLRLRPGAVCTLDEIEVNTPTQATPDAAFALELTATELNPPHPTLLFNEITEASASGFGLEVINSGDAAIALGGMQITRSVSGSTTFTFPPESLAPGQRKWIAQGSLGFGAVSGTKLFLYSAGRGALLDTVTVQSRARARFPDGGTEWRTPSARTPGEANVFATPSQIVVNEIMVQARPWDAKPAAVSNAVALAYNGTWRYDDTGRDLGTEWRLPNYDDHLWTQGSGLFGVNSASGPVTNATTLTSGRTTYYFRTPFVWDGTTNRLNLLLRSWIDDGAVFYLNGTEVLRMNLPGGTVRYSTPALQPIGNITQQGPFTLSLTNLVIGTNWIAAEVHQAAGGGASAGVVVSGGGLKLVEEGPTGSKAPPNLATAPGTVPFVIDSLIGYPIHDYLHLNDGIYGNPNSWIGNSGNPGYAGLRFAQLSTVSSIAFSRDNTGSGTDRTLGLYTLQYTKAPNPGPKTTVTGDPTTGWVTVGTMNYQSVGTGDFSFPSRRHRLTFNAVEATGIRLLVPGTGLGSGTCVDELEVNPPETSGDIAFGAELQWSTTLSPATPFTKSTEEWVELYNPGTESVTLSGWSLAGAANYIFPEGVKIPAKGYLVVANDPETFLGTWPELRDQVVGPFSSKMSPGETLLLQDPSGNAAYRLTVPFGIWAQGGGSSLELRDPRIVHPTADAWSDSDESAAGSWETIRYRMTAGQRLGSSLWNEFRLGMLDAGEVWIDDVSVVRDPDGSRQELIQNGNFETLIGNLHWRWLGNHGTSSIIADPDRPSNHLLRVVASSPARTSHNHIESTFIGNTPVVDDKVYEVSFRARWIAGATLINSSAYFQRLAQTTVLNPSRRHGTPGRQNSRYVANSGPNVADFIHSPVVPLAKESVTVTLHCEDPDGVAGVTLFYRTNPAPTFLSVAMTQQPDGAWIAALPGYNAGSIVQIYAQATDTRGATSFAPALGPDSRALYQVADTQGRNLPAHELRLIQLDADRDFILNTTNLLSQRRLGGTLIYDRKEIFYDVAVRLHGSAAGRARDGDDYISYDIGFPDDHLFRGKVASAGIDRSGRTPTARQQDEIYILHMFQQAGLPCHRDDLCNFIAPKKAHTGTAILQLGAYDATFVDEQYSTDGSIFNFDMTYEPSTTLVTSNVESLKVPVPLQEQLGTDLTDLGDDKEQYRASFDIRHGERGDDFSGIMRLCKTMGLGQEPFEANVETALDLQEAMRVTALTILCGIADIYFNAEPSNPHNSRIFTPADGSPAQFLPWDMDFVFYNDAGGSILPTTTFNISKWTRTPKLRRQYLWHVADLCQSVIDPGYMTPWLTHYGTVVGQSFVGGTSYLQTRQTAALKQLPPFLKLKMNVGSLQGQLVKSDAALLTGEAWLDLDQIKLEGSDTSLLLGWTSITQWQTSLPLHLGVNELTVTGYDRARRILGQQTLSITSTALGSPSDLDADGLPDAWETAHGLEPLVNDAQADPDGDGLTNLQEYLAGTDPRDARQALSLRAERQEDGVYLRFRAMAGRSYTLLAADQIGSGTWEPVAEMPAGVADRDRQFRDTDLTSRGERYYRLQLNPAD